MRLGAITIGQAPRTDVTGDIEGILPPGTELLQGGGLDGLTRQEIEAFAPEEGDYVLVSRLNDGSSVTFAEKHILPMLQKRINELEEQGASLIMFFCTGSFPDTLTSKVPLIFPCEILLRMVPLLTKQSSIIVITPSKAQLRQSREHWEKYVSKVKVIGATPYGGWEELMEAAEEAKEEAGDLIVLDCIGYTSEMKKLFHETTGKNVVLPRTLLARVAAEIADV